MKRTHWAIWCLCLLGSSAALAQQTGQLPVLRVYDPTPPLGALWEMRANGDAWQKDLGFLIPAQWKGFKRLGFSSGRADGGSVNAYYESEDHAMKLTLLLQLRIDMRGLPMDADMVWDFLKIVVTSGMSCGRRTVISTWNSMKAPRCQAVTATVCDNRSRR